MDDKVHPCIQILPDAEGCGELTTEMKNKIQVIRIALIINSPV
jgi:hypothetical protein